MINTALRALLFSSLLAMTMWSFAQTDPTRPPILTSSGVQGEKDAAPEPPKVSMMVKRSETSLIMLADGRMLRVGDSADQHQLIKINSNSVVFAGPQGEVTQMIYTPNDTVKRQ